MLDYKIKQLKALIDPKTRDIREMQAQIQAMDSELVDYHRQGKLSAMELGQLKLKHKALRDEISAQRQQIAQGEQRMRRLQLDIYECIQHLQDPKKLKESVTALYRKHLTSEVRPAEVDADILKEQTRQRDYLEKSVECLKKRLGKDSEMHRQDNVKLMQENAALICEINDLRKEVFALHSESQRKFQGKAIRVEGSKRPPSRRGPQACETRKVAPVVQEDAKDQEAQAAVASGDQASSHPTLPAGNSTHSGDQPNDLQGVGTVAEECAKLIATQANEIAALREKLQSVEKQLEAKDASTSPGEQITAS